MADNDKQGNEEPQLELNLKDSILEVILKKLDYWKKKLIDLSKRNNLVSYRETKSKSIKVNKPTFSQIIQDLQSETPIQFSREDQEKLDNCLWLANEEEEIVEKKLYTLYLKARENFQELGVNTCFMGLGQLLYLESDSSDQPIKAPIFLYPVELNRLSSAPKSKHRIEIVTGSGEIQLNPALKEKLSHEFGIELKNLQVDQEIGDYLDYLKEKIAGMKGWTINKNIYLDIFSYQKHIMYEDLIKYEELIKNSDLIKGYVGDDSAIKGDFSDLIEGNFKDTNDIEILPADSSQKKAIELAKAGATFVLQGPPGTGKSQTIANIIAALMEKKKKILFVSQKMAALDVVKKRLDEVGLGRYCLNLHNYKGNKKEIVQQLVKELNFSPRIQDSILRYTYTDYLKAQDRLNLYYDYVNEKHGERTLSIYEIRGKLAKLHETEIINESLSLVLNFDEEKFSNLSTELERIDEILTKVNRPLETRYFYFNEEKNSLLSRDKFKKALQDYHENLLHVIAFIEDVLEVTDYKLQTIEKTASFLQLHDEFNTFKKNIPSFLINSTNFFANKKVIFELCDLSLKLADLSKKILLSVNSKFLSENLKKHEKVFYESKFLTRFFDKNYIHSKKYLNSFAKSKLGHNNWLKLFKLKKDYLELFSKKEKLEKENLPLVKKVDELKDLQTLIDLTENTKKLSKVLQKLKEFNPKIKFKFLKYMYNNDSCSTQFSQILKQHERVSEYFKNSNQLKLFEKEIYDLKQEVSELWNDYEKLDEILEFKKLYGGLSKEIKTFIKTYFKENVKSSLFNCFSKSYYLQLLETIQKDFPSPKDKADLLLSQDLEVRDNKRYKIMNQIESFQPTLNYQSRGGSELNILKREGEKRRRLKPIRDLLRQISNIAFDLKPCFMMSPLTVSQYIDPTSINFDVVIFDEASQIMPEDAVTCLMRAKQAIIMGDTQQLPPTTFFLGQVDDEMVEEEIEDLESFLSESSTRFLSASLDWHYRSKNENLIAFSNRYFYENRLITFPNSKIEDKSGLDYIYLKNGVYDRGKSRKNMVEAKKVVEVYKQLKKDNLDKTFGIIAFSMQQENAIREAFEVNNIDINGAIGSQEEELFIKNLETVQGDERDIIIISVGYGKDSAGKFTYNFGPLNKDNGYKRLNVAITRSRFKTVVITSLNPSELDEDKIRAGGVRHLKNYLDYAKNKEFGQYTQTSEGMGFDSDFEEAVYQTLVDEGYSVSSQIGCSGYRVDLAIKHPKRPGEYLLGIECDGAQYHSSRYARDRDKIRQFVLENLGWSIHRIWSDDWLSNKEVELNKIKTKVESLIKNNNPRKKKDNFSKVEDVEGFKEIKLDSIYQKYKIAEVTQKKTTLSFYTRYKRYRCYQETQLKKVMFDILSVEAPIEKEFLYKKTLKTYGVSKLGTRLKKLLDYLVSQMRFTNSIKVYGETVSLKAINKTFKTRISTEEERPFHLIPKEELSGAVVDLLKNAGSINKKALIDDIAKEIFGNNRVGNKINKKMNVVIKYLIQEKIVSETDHNISLQKNNL